MHLAEQQILDELRRLPAPTRRHLVGIYSDSVALFHLLLEGATDQASIQEMKKQQSIYARIAKALLDTLEGAEPSG